MRAVRLIAGVVILSALAVAPAPPVHAESRDLVAWLQEIKGLIEAAQYAAAETQARQLLARARQEFAEDSVEVGDGMILLAETLAAQGRLDEPEARSLLDRALRIGEAAVATDRPGCMRILTSSASVYELAGEWTDALALLERAMVVVRESEGPLRDYEAYYLNRLAWARFKLVEYDKAQELFERALAKLEKSVGPEHIFCAWTLQHMGILRTARGEFDRAVADLERALAIRRNSLPPADPQIADTLNSLGVVHWRRGEGARANELLIEALRIREDTYGSEHPLIAGVLSNLGLVAVARGDYVEGRRYHERAVDIVRRVQGRDHPDVAAPEANLAFLLWNIGDYEEARRLLEHSIEIRRRSLGPRHVEVGRALTQLGIFAKYLGDPSEAERLYDRAQGILEESLGPDHQLTVHNVVCRAMLYTEIGQAAKAKPLIDRAAASSSASLRSMAWQTRAALQRGEGDYAAARKSYERLLNSSPEAGGSPSLKGRRELLWGYAVTLLLDGDPGNALLRAIHSENLARDSLRTVVGSSSERQALHYVSATKRGVDVALSSILPSSSPAQRGLAWDALIRSRAIVLDEMAGRRRSLSGSDNPEIASLEQAVRDTRRRLANLTVRGISGDLSPEDYAALLDDAAREKETAERALADKSSGFRARLARAELGMEEVAGVLSDGSALVAFVRYDRFGDRPAASYAAFVLPAARAEIEVVDLGTAREIEAAVSRWRDEVPRGIATGEKPDPRVMGAYERLGTALRRKIWDPLVPHLGNAERVFIVPDGALHAVSFAALPSGRDRYLLETAPAFHYLAAERELVRTDVPAPSGSGLLALGGPAFDETKSLSASGSGALRGADSACADFRDLHFVSLPGTGQEAAEIVRLWDARLSGSDATQVGATLLRGATASEAAFKRLAPGRRVLHLATHGFFLGDRCGAMSGSTRGVGGVVRATPQDAAGKTIVGDSPLLLSGLGLAGANRRAAAGADDEDGILTAEEIAALDLSGVEWAVLSACDSGGGTVRAGEGVFGLQRAFQVAGAQTVIMSLWAVEDESTRRWMTALYEGRLGRNLDTASAVREASLEMLRQRRRDGETTHPFYWAGFIATGDWR